MEKRERKRRVSIDQRILRETQSIIASHYSIWKHLVWRYFPEVQITSEKDLINLYPDLIHKARLSYRFEIVSIHDPESWKLFFHDRTIGQCFENYFEVVEKVMQDLVDNFKIHLDPELLGYILELRESQYFREVRSIFETDVNVVVSELGRDPDHLSSYLSSIPEHIGRIIELGNYCRDLSLKIEELVSFTSTHYDIGQYFRNPLTVYTHETREIAF